MSMLQAYFADLEAGLKAKLDENFTARRKFIYEIARMGGRMFDDAWASAWTTVFVPFEILYAMGVGANFIEFVGAMLSGSGMARPYFEAAEAQGFSTDSCSYHRTIIGAAIRKDLFPRPDLLIGASFPCDGGVKALKRVGELYGLDVFVIHTPYTCSEESVRYLVAQFRELIRHITARTGRTLDEDKLRRAVHNNNLAREHIVAALELCKNRPSPARSEDWKNFIIYVLLGGSDEAVEVARAYHEEFRRKHERGIAGLENERRRLLWIQNRIQFRNDLLRTLEERFGANVVIDELNYVYWEPMDEAGDPLEAIARRQLLHPLIGPAERRLDLLKKMAVEFGVDGGVNPSHWGCRQSGGARNLFKEALAQVNVPVIHLDVDCVDERNFSEGQLFTRLEAFMEMM